MWDLIKNDPILKAISVFVLGVFAFSFAFSIMFGSGQSGMEHSTGTSGYNAVSSLGTIIILLSKLLIIIILTAIIIAVVKLIQKHIVGNVPIKGIETLKGNPLTGILLGLAGVLILLSMVSVILPSNSSNDMASSSINYSYNNYSLGTTAILSSAARLITALSFIGLITGLIMYFKSQYFSNVKSVNTVSKEPCPKCGLELKAGWKCCPICGTNNDADEKVQKTKDE